MEINIKTGDFLMIILVAVLAGAAFLMAGGKQQGEYVHVMADGKRTAYSLSEERIIKLGESDSQYNTVVIEDHQVFMEDASCPDRICVRHKAISKNGESIICLPNQVFVEIESQNKKETDN